MDRLIKLYKRFDILRNTYRAYMKHYYKRWLNAMRTKHAYIYI